MSDRVQMPALGESVTEGTVTRWLKQVGDRVNVDEPLLEVSTDKVDTEIPSPVAGVIEQILVAEDETVAVGTPLVVIGAQEGAAPIAVPVQSGPVQSGPVQSGPVQSAPAQSAPAQSAPAQSAPPFEPAPPAERTPPAPTEATRSVAEQPAPAQESAAGSRIQMPALGESVTEGTVTRWLKAEGDTVEVDEPLLEVSTDKVDTEIPSPVAGVVRKILVGEDETVAVGVDLAIVGPAGPTAQTPAPAPAPPAATAPVSAAAPPAPLAAPPAPTPTPAVPAQGPAAEDSLPLGAPTGPMLLPSARPAVDAQAQRRGAAIAGPAPASLAGADLSTYVTPLVRKMAAERGVDLAAITGTGVGGRLRKQDVLDAAKAAEAARTAAPATSPPAGTPQTTRPGPSALRGTTEKMSRLRRVIAQRMVESLQVSAQLTTVVEVDVTKIARLRARARAEFEAREGVKLSFLPFFALAAVEALKHYPVVNASISGDEINYHAEENLGVAVDTERGLLVPVIHGAGDLNIAGLARKIADLADRTRLNKVTPDELGGGTFTLTNTGSRGALFDTPIINQPQVAILGTGSVVKRPVVVNDADGGETIAVRSMVYLAMSYDHRLVDGADAARFLGTVKARLEEGAFDADLGV